MKEHKLYTCEHCGISYSDKNEALRCEENHKTKLKIVKRRYMGMRQDASGFPWTITVSDGTVEVTYKRG